MNFYYRFFSKIYGFAAKRMCLECSSFIKNNSGILDIGCGSAVIANQFQRFFHAEITGVDVRDHRISPIRFRLIDGFTVPLPNNSFDVVLINYVLHHSQNPLALLAEAKRMVKDKIIVYEDLPEGFLPKLWCMIHTNLFDAFFKNPAKTSFKTKKEWEEIFKNLELNVVFEKRVRNFPNKQQMFVLMRV